MDQAKSKEGLPVLRLGSGWSFGFCTINFNVDNLSYA